VNYFSELLNVYVRRDPLRSPRDTLYPQKLALTPLTSGRCSVGNVRSQTEAAEFYLHRLIDVKQIEIHIAESFMPDPNPFEVEITIARLKACKSPGSDEIPA
jgi:hypothetical protein